MLVPDLDVAVRLVLAVPDDFVFLIADWRHDGLLYARLPGLSPAISDWATGSSGGTVVAWESRGQWDPQGSTGADARLRVSAVAIFRGVLALRSRSFPRPKSLRYNTQ